MSSKKQEGPVTAADVAAYMNAHNVTAIDSRSVAIAMRALEEERQEELNKDMARFTEWACLTAEQKTQLVADNKYNSRVQYPLFRCTLVDRPAGDSPHKAALLHQPVVLMRAQDQANAREQYLELCGIRSITEPSVQFVSEVVAQPGQPAPGPSEMGPPSWTRTPEGDLEKVQRELAELKDRVAGKRPAGAPA
jgi:hypothetical protein